MNKNYRETKNDLIHCPFNPNHLVKRSRLITHKKLCPDKNNRGIVQCPYNPSHHILIENLDKHKEKCPDRNIINNDLANEMEAYIKGLRTGKVKKNVFNNIPAEGKENDKNKANEIIGLTERKRNGKNNKISKKHNIKQVLFNNQLFVFGVHPHFPCFLHNFHRFQKNQSHILCTFYH